jgi:hypothetical protein
MGCCSEFRCTGHGIDTTILGQGWVSGEFPSVGATLAVLGSVLPGSLRVTRGRVSPVLGTDPVDSEACLGSGYGVNDRVL